MSKLLRWGKLVNSVTDQGPQTFHNKDFDPQALRPALRASTGFLLLLLTPEAVYYFQRSLPTSTQFPSPARARGNKMLFSR